MSMYLRLIDKDAFGFVTSDIHEILENDIEITEKMHNGFFELQSQGKQFRLKTIPTGTGLFDYVEEYIPDPLPPAEIPKTELEIKVEILENENADLLLDSVKKDIKIEQNELDIADLLLAIGGM